MNLQHLYSMPEKKHRVNVTIPIDLYSKIPASGYGLTEAIIKGLRLVLAPQEPSNTTERKSEVFALQDSMIADLREQIKIKDNQLEKLTELMYAQAINLQTLLAPKQIESHLITIEKERLDSTEEETIKTEETGAHTVQSYKKSCIFCENKFTSMRPTAKYCSEKCRSAYRRQKEPKK